MKVLMNAINDPEIIFSHLLNLAYIGQIDTKNKIPQYKREILFFRMALAIYFRNKFKEENCFLKYETDYKQNIVKLLQYFHSTSSKLSVITTNYDMGFEKIIDDTFDRNMYYYPGIGQNSDVNIKIPILKLHGSINWMEDRGKLSHDGFWNPSRGKPKLDILDNLRVLPLKKNGEFTLEYMFKKYSPVLVPFFFQKETWNTINQQWWGEIFNTIWVEARKIIIQANKIIFLGYGLPSADHHMFSFLYEVLKQTSAQITVVDVGEKDSNLIKMVKSIFRDTGKLSICKNGIEQYLNQCVEPDYQ